MPSVDSLPRSSASAATPGMSARGPRSAFDSAAPKASRAASHCDTAVVHSALVIEPAERSANAASSVAAWRSEAIRLAGCAPTAESCVPSSAAYWLISAPGMDTSRSGRSADNGNGKQHRGRNRLHDDLSLVGHATVISSPALYAPARLFPGSAERTPRQLTIGNFSSIAS